MYLLDGGRGDGADDDIHVDKGRIILLKYTQACFWFCSKGFLLSQPLFTHQRGPLQSYPPGRMMQRG